VPVICPDDSAKFNSGNSSGEETKSMEDTITSEKPIDDQVQDPVIQVQNDSENLDETNPFYEPNVEAQVLKETEKVPEPEKDEVLMKEPEPEKDGVLMKDPEPEKDGIEVVAPQPPKKPPRKHKSSPSTSPTKAVSSSPQPQENVDPQARPQEHVSPDSTMSVDNVCVNNISHIQKQIIKFEQHYSNH